MRWLAWFTRFARPAKAACSAVVLLSLLVACGSGPQPEMGSWRAWLDSPGGALPFGVELVQQNGELRSWIVNGSERIAVPKTHFVQGELVFEMTHYDAEIRAVPSGDGRKLDGTWKKTAGKDKVSQLAFHATYGETPRFEPQAGASDVKDASVDGRWAVQFASDEQSSVGIFESMGGEIVGTFMNTTGDYRYLAGSFEAGRLRLSCFDGAHAFLFDAQLNPDGTLAGDFWSRDTWHETWTARRDADADLPSAWDLTEWQDGAQLGAFGFPDLDGKTRRLSDPEFAGKARLIEVFGSWCPNCRDATHYMVELDQRYREQGLAVLGLAFELTGDFERDTAQVRSYATQHSIEYPLLVAGLSNKAEASKAFPALDRVHAYPTMIFVDAQDNVRGIYTGFNGPATGAAHTALKRQFEELIETMLREASS